MNRSLLIVLLVATAILAAGCAGAGTQTSTTLRAASPATAPPTTGPPGTQPSPTQPPATAPPTTAPPTTIAPTAGSSGSGDPYPYFPAQGNGGYDVQNYEISLDIDPVSGRIAGEDAVTAIALQDLSALDLDLQGLDVSAVKIDGTAATFARIGQELKVVCPLPVAKGASFTVTVTYSGIPVAIPTKLLTMGWQKVGDTIFTLDEPQGADSWFPVNDTPSDKATYTLHLTVPAPYTAAANGVLAGTETKGAARTFTWKMDEPMASYLVAVDVGKFSLETSTSAGGVPIRNYFATDLASTAHAAFSRTGDVIDYFAGLFGPYPFALYGVVVLDADIGAAMENQTLSLYGRDVVTKRMNDPIAGAIFLSHELAHQWFGDSVTIKSWNDIWLNEAFATYASWLWLERDQGRQAFDGQVKRSQQILSQSPEPPPGAPGADHMFGAGVYLRGALTLHALRLTVGDDTFFRILRTWADRHKYSNADTADFIALAKEQAPQVPAARLDALLQAWLYGAGVPTLPTAPSPAGAPGSGPGQ